MWAFRIGLSYVLVLWANMGVMGVWVAMFADWVFRAIPSSSVFVVDDGSTPSRKGYNLQLDNRWKEISVFPQILQSIKKHLLNGRLMAGGFQHTCINPFQFVRK